MGNSEPFLFGCSLGLCPLPRRNADIHHRMYCGQVTLPLLTTPNPAQRTLVRGYILCTTLRDDICQEKQFIKEKLV